MMRTASWIADYPDADNFMQLLYGKNIGQSNNALREDPRVRQALRAVAPHAGFARAQPALSRDGAHHRGVRAVAARHQRATATC